MESQSANTSNVPDHELNESLSAAEPDELDGLSIQNERLAKIQEYEEAAVARLDPYDAVIGMGNAYLQRIFEHMGAAILEQLDGRPHTIQDVRELNPEIRLMLQMRRAIEADDKGLAPELGHQTMTLPSSPQRNRLGTTSTPSKLARPHKGWMAKD